MSSGEEASVALVKTQYLSDQVELIFTAFRYRELCHVIFVFDKNKVMPLPKPSVIELVDFKNFL